MGGWGKKKQWKVRVARHWAHSPDQQHLGKHNPWNIYSIYICCIFYLYDEGTWVTLKLKVCFYTKLSTSVYLHPPLFSAIPSPTSNPSIHTFTPSHTPTPIPHSGKLNFVNSQCLLSSGIYYFLFFFISHTQERSLSLFFWLTSLRWDSLDLFI